MKPHSLQSVQHMAPSRRAAFEALGPIAKRHGPFPKGAVLPETQVQACPRVKIADFPDGFIPPKYYEGNLEQNQLLHSCCRHPENHEIEARKSHPDEDAPDIYVFHCTCGRKHTRWLLGAVDDVPRPIWDAS
jgi:hypothetical protein